MKNSKKRKINRWLAKYFLCWKVDKNPGSDPDSWINNKGAAQEFVGYEDFFKPERFVLIIEECQRRGIRLQFNINPGLPDIPKESSGYSSATFKLMDGYNGFCVSNCMYVALYQSIMRALKP